MSKTVILTELQVKNLLIPAIEKSKEAADELTKRLVKIDKLDIGSMNKFNRELKEALNNAKSLQAHLDKIGKSGFRPDFSRTLRDRASDALPELGGVGIGDFAGSAGSAAAMGITAVAAGIADATSKAIDFQHSFLSLEQLNLDKSNGQIDSLRENVLKTSNDIGISSDKMTTAFFDYQSSIGKFSTDAVGDITKLGKFARNFGADFNNYVSSAGKSMLAYGETDVDKYNEAIYRTAMLGSMNTDQAGRLQADFASNASSSRQSANSAGKAFLLQSQMYNTADEAATGTKEFFKDLSDERNLEAFDKLKIKVYDTNNQMRQFDEIFKDLAQKTDSIKGNDRELAKVINLFSGSEGFINMVKLFGQRSETAMEQLNKYNTVTYNMAKATQNADKDITLLTEKLKVNFNNELTKLGTELLPAATIGLKVFSQSIEGIGMMVKGVGAALSAVWHAPDTIRNWGRETQMHGRKTSQNWADVASYGLGTERIDANDTKKHYFDGKVLDYVGSSMQYLEGANKEQQKEIYTNMISVLNSDGYKGRGGKKYYEAILQDKLQTLRTEDLKSKSLSELIGQNKADGKSKKPTALPDLSAAKKDRDDTLGGGKNIRNINVTIQRMNGVESFHIQNTRDFDPHIIGEAINRTLVKAVQDTEIAISSN
jgi:hypothetical protein